MDFSNFSPDSFEQFTQALAIKVLGGGVTIFGNGPDGASFPQLKIVTELFIFVANQVDFLAKTVVQYLPS